ncbi:MAG: DISARM system phospholipase D-like protein DrmC [Bryobacteraceae bacterium]
MSKQPQFLRQLGTLIAELPPSEVERLADLVGQCGSAANDPKIINGFSPHSRREIVRLLLTAWRREAPELLPGAISAALTAVAANIEQARTDESVELVWTGPDSEVIPVRHTEQVLLEMIERASSHLTLVSYAVHRIGRIREALLSASARGIRVRIVLEGADPQDSPETYKTLWSIGPELASSASIYFWPEAKRVKDANGKTGRLHVKCLVVDDVRLYLSSANLTEQAFTLNMELGLLLHGAKAARQIEMQFDALIRRGILMKI